MTLSILLVTQVVLGIALIVLVLLQQGKGADMGAAFGSGASGTVFGSQGSANFMTRATAIVAALFMINSLALSTTWVLGDRKPTSVTEIPGSVVNEPAKDLNVPEAPNEAADTAAPADLPAMDESTDSAPSDSPAMDESGTKPPSDLPE